MVVMETLSETPIPTTLNDLEQASRTQLAQWYQTIIGKPPVQSSRKFLFQRLAWHLQAQQQGLNPKAIHKAVLKALQQARPGSGQAPTQGTRLVREWQGETYEVTVLKDGYRWNDTQYRSLSKIAQEITGAKWSGPRFFGLKEKKA